MERIGNTLNRVVKAPNFAARYEEMRQEIMANPGVQKFLTAHSSEINSEVIERSLGKLYEYTTASHRCEKCTDLSNCINIMNGFEPELVLTRGLIDVGYAKCPSKLIDEDERNVSRMIESMHMQKDVWKHGFQIST